MSRLESFLAVRLSHLSRVINALQEIARRHPHEVTVLDTRAFFWPGWWGNDVQMVHETDDYDFHASGQYA
jgi:hypothetical protein